MNSDEDRTKRPSVDDSECDGPTSYLQRDTTDIRASLLLLHNSLCTFSDVTVVVEHDGASREFPCVSAVLASASRPLAAMLYGALREVTPCAADSNKPRLVLRGTEPWCFESLMRYMHGLHVGLDVDTALPLYSTADYYEVLGLRDGCCGLLLGAVHANNCCQLLAQARAVNCEPLEERCMDFLSLENLSSVAKNDPHFGDLDPSLFERILSRNDLVCEAETHTLDALLRWYNMRPSSDRYTWLLRLLQKIRWGLIPESEHAFALEHIARLSVPSAEEMAMAPSRQTTELWPEEGQAAAGSKRKREEDAPSEESEAFALVRALLGAPTEDSPNLRRLCSWGRLTIQWPPLADPFVSPSAAVADAQAAAAAAVDVAASGRVEEHVLACTHEYTIGRSRRCKIRVGHNSPQPYISSQHFRLFYTVVWPERPSDGSPPTAPPRLQPWIEDLSQNGTYINGVLVGRGKRRRLQHGDRVELVFAQGLRSRNPESQNQQKFPGFIFSLPEAGGQVAALATAAQQPVSPGVAANEENETMLMLPVMAD